MGNSNIYKQIYFYLRIFRYISLNVQINPCLVIYVECQLFEIFEIFSAAWDLLDSHKNVVISVDLEFWWILSSDSHYLMFGSVLNFYIFFYYSLKLYSHYFYCISFLDIKLCAIDEEN